jgi:hypothetical protein
MSRSTALIRDVLVHWLMLRWIEQEKQVIERSALGRICVDTVLDPLHQAILWQVNRTKRELRQAGVHVLAQHISGKEIAIEYKQNQQIHHANYPIPILFADAEARLTERIKGRYADCNTSMV